MQGRGCVGDGAKVTGREDEVEERFSGCVSAHLAVIGAREDRQQWRRRARRPALRPLLVQLDCAYGKIAVAVTQADVPAGPIMGQVRVCATTICRSRVF